MADKGFSFEIEEQIGKLSEGRWIKELNLIKWGKNPVKFDIRDWNETHTSCGKGVTFTMVELKKLRDILNDMELTEEGE